MNTVAFPRKVAIIGGGAGGLSTAVILAKLGCDVTVYEKNFQPGGLMRSYRRGGIDCEVGVHYLGSLDKGQVLRTFFDYLGVSDAIPVTRMGQNGVIDRYHLQAPSSPSIIFDLVEGIDAYAHNLALAFPEETGVIEILAREIRKAARQLHNLDFLNAADNDFSLLDQFRPMGEIVDELKCSPALRSILAIPSCWIGVPFDDCPAYYHHMALASYVSSSWRLDNSGAAMADALAARLESLGGKLVTGEKISRILVESRVVGGVELATGERVEADTVIAAVHPKVVVSMLKPEDTKPSYRQRIAGIFDTHGIFCAHVMVDSQSCEVRDHNIFKIETDADGGVEDMKYYQIRASEQQGINLLSILTSGNDTVWEPWRQTFSGRRGPDYENAKYRHAAKLVAESEDLLGPLGETTLLDTYTPLTLRDWVGSPGGSAYGVRRSCSQMLATALLNRTAVKGLYLAGQNVLAPGIVGTFMGSFATVKLLLGREEFGQLVRF